MEHTIAFPEVGLEFTLNRVAFQVFGKDIYWYGLIICFGFLLGAYYLSRRVNEFGFTVDNEFDIMLWAIPVGLIFARTYYVACEWDSYSKNPTEIIKIWNGGIAIYGGIIGAILVIYVYGKMKRLSILGMLDLASLGLLIGQAIGRWGNFVNAEAHGGETSLPWRMQIDGMAGVHPTFLYESLWNFLGFVLLHFRSKKRRFAGEIFLMYVAWYGFGRMWIEGMRTDSLYLFGTDLRTSQVLAAVSCIVAIILLIRGYRKHRAYAVPTEIRIPTEEDASEIESETTHQPMDIKRKEEIENKNGEEPKT